MKSFKEFLLTEAAFNVNKFSKVLELFERLISKKVGKVYRYGGHDGVVNLKSADGVGLGFLYFYGNGQAFRINYVKQGSTFGFDSIDIWVKFNLNNFEDNIKPAFRIKLPHDVNIVKTVDTIASVLKNPREGAKVFVVESMDAYEMESLLTEAQKVDFPQFLNLVMKAYPTKFNNLTYKDIKAVADSNDVTIPGVVWGMKAGRGVFDLSQTPGDVRGSGDHSSPVPPTSATDLLLISRGPDGKFYKMEPATAPESELKKAQVQIDRVLKTQEAKEMTPAHILFEDMEDLVTIVATGQRPSLMVVGGPGIGKTHTVISTVKKCGLADREDYVIVKGKATPSALYRTFFLNHDKLIIFDVTDSVFKDMNAVNILKAALDSYDVRMVSWLSNQTVNVSTLAKADYNDFIDDVRNRLYEDPEANVKLPSEFEFTGRVIFISNLKKSELDTAVLSRSLTIDMTLTQEQVLDRMQSIMQYLGNPDQSIEDKMEVLDHLREITRGGGSGFGEINMRTFIAALGVKASGTPNWKRLLKYT